MRYTFDDQGEEFYPRLINWELGPAIHAGGVENDPGTMGDEGAREVFTLHECLLTIDSIARLAKPIVVLAGGRALQRPDVFEIVEYGTALGLKMIVEARPETLSGEIVRTFSVFGPRVFRLLLDDCITEDPGTRYKESPQFVALGSALELLQKAGYEIHLGVTTATPLIRQLAFQHDYAFRHSAKGLYCHLDFDSSQPSSVDEESEEHSVNEFIEAIARMKHVSPKAMYVSPQCIKYGFNDFENGRENIPNNDDFQQGETNRPHRCLGGKSFAFISPVGSVQVCSGLSQECGNLRANRYDFKSIWEKSHVFQQLRQQVRTCSETRTEQKAMTEFMSDTEE